MGEKKNSPKNVGEALGGVFLSLVFGIIGGGLCGAAILVFGGLIGRSGTTGTEYFGYWSVDIIWLGLLYGGFFGSFVGSLAYPFLIRKIGLQKSILPGFIGTIVGGFIGAVAGPPVAVLTGICGFLLALFWRRIKLTESGISASE
jgi:hypothetical protein